MKERVRARSFGIVLLATMAILACPAIAGSVDRQAPGAFRVEAGVHIGEDGRIAAVTPDPALHPVLVDSLTAAVKRLRFQPLELEGRPVEGDTHVRMRGCAMPVEGGISVVYEFEGTGPGLGRAVPLYPPEAARAGVSAGFNVVYRVEPDGSGIVESMEPDASSRPDPTVDGRRIAGMFNSSIKEWVESRTYVPEAIDGHAVATRLRRQVRFVAPGRPSRRDRTRASSESAPLCDLAASGEDADYGDIVLDSRFVLVPDA